MEGGRGKGMRGEGGGYIEGGRRREGAERDYS